jgi:hypothetical protein
MSGAKVKEKKSRKKNNSYWFELMQEKEEFKRIVSILNRFYNLQPSAKHPTPAHVFREEIVLAEVDKLRIFLKKFGSFEFLVVVEIATELGKKMDSWIHIDGIAQERLIMKEKGKLDHPVFKITSLDDLYQKYTIELEKGFELKAEESIIL